VISPRWPRWRCVAQRRRKRRDRREARDDNCLGKSRGEFNRSTQQRPRGARQVRATEQQSNSLHGNARKRQETTDLPRTGATQCARASPATPRVQRFGVDGMLLGTGALPGVLDPPVPASSVRFRAGCFLLGIGRRLSTAGSGLCECCGDRLNSPVLRGAQDDQVQVLRFAQDDRLSAASSQFLCVPPVQSLAVLAAENAAEDQTATIKQEPWGPFHRGP
jgi:hypothetical protein